ncbi:MAG: hypothetical protein V4640_12035 [Verrucomicrobiota bacterium]
MIEIAFPCGKVADCELVSAWQDGGNSIYQYLNGHLWLLRCELSADWISLTALVNETISAGADVAVVSVAWRDTESPPLWAEGIAMIREELWHRILADDATSRRLTEYGIVVAAKLLDPDVKILEWSKDESFQRHFHPDYPNCGDTPVVPGIRFPVMDAAIHAGTCGLYLDLADRMGGRVSRYQGEKMRGWFLEDYGRWQEQFGMEGAAMVLEIGATDGVNTNAMLDLLFPHPHSEVHAIRSVVADAGEDFFETNAAAGGHEGQVSLYQGEAVEILAWMISTEGFWESFDFMHVRPSREPLTALTTACQAWALLKPGGTMVVDFSGRASLGEHPALGSLADFVRVAGGRASGIESHWMALQKGVARE